MKQFYLLIAITSLSVFSLGAQVTFSQDIAPIIFKNCTGCHRAGEIGPMPFTTYQEVANWADMIAHVTNTKYMPPWPPDANFQHFVNERVLTEDEIQLLADWASNGAPEGDPAQTPAPPVFPDGSQIGVPDLVVEMEQAHTIIGNNRDDYRVFVLPTNFTEDKEIASLEFRADNTRAVHHVLFGFDETGRARQLDAASPGYGYYSFGDFGFNEAKFLSWGYVPGNTPLVFPEGIGSTLPAGADLLIQVHYAPLPTTEIDQSSVNIFFKDEDDPIEREVIRSFTLPHNLPGGWNSFRIPANQEISFKATDFYLDDASWPGVDYDVSLISVQPHSHYLGTSYKLYAVTPQNDTINIIHIPKWDFNWQGAYTLERMLKIPAGSRWYTEATYDNTTNNPFNPSNPPRTVRWGEGTEDEMLVVFYSFVPYQEGDENIVLGEGDVTNNYEINGGTNSVLYRLHPNPSRGQLTIPFLLKEKETLTFELYNRSGQLVRTLQTADSWAAGGHRLGINISDLPDGNYVVTMRGEGYALSQQVVLMR